MEIGAEAILKATKVDGIYDSDPMLNPSAKFFEKLTYIEVLKKGLLSWTQPLLRSAWRITCP